MKKIKGKSLNERIEHITSKIADKIAEKFTPQFEVYEDDITTIIALLAEIKFYMDEEKRKNDPAHMPLVPVEKVR